MSRYDTNRNETWKLGSDDMSKKKRAILVNVWPGPDAKAHVVIDENAICNVNSLPVSTAAGTYTISEFDENPEACPKCREDGRYIILRALDRGEIIDDFCGRARLRGVLNSVKTTVSPPNTIRDMLVRMWENGMIKVSELESIHYCGRFGGADDEWRVTFKLRKGEHHI